MPAWAEKLKKNWANTRLAHEGLALERMQRQGALVERLVRKTQDGTLGQSTDEPEDEVDEMGVAIGNEIHYHYGPSESPAPSPQAPTPSKLATAAKLAAIMAGCGSVPLAGVGLHSLLSGPDEPPAVQEAAAPDLSGYGVQVEKQASKGAVQ